MEKGHLSIKQLESMKKADLQDLAKKMGVSADGTVKELAARIAEIEVDVPEENELTEKEKAAAEGEKTEAADGDEPEEVEKQPEKTADQKEPEAGKARVKAITRYLDKQLNEIKEAGEEFTVSVERAAELTAAKVVDIIK